MLAALLAFAGPVHPEVIMLENGTIFLGKVVSLNSVSTVINQFGKDNTVPTTAILSNMKDVSSLKKTAVSIVLKDDTTITGTIENFDDEIGVLANIGFGTLTIPVSSIKTMYSGAQRQHYLGSPRKFGGTLGLQKVTGEFAGDFSLFPRICLYGEFMIPGVRGLFAGIDLSFRAMAYAGSDELDYRTFSLRPYLVYSFLGFRAQSGFFSRTVPFVSLHLGVAYSTLEDNRPFATANIVNELNPEGALRFGFDIDLNRNLGLRIAAEYAVILQDGGSYGDLSFMLGLHYGL